MLTEIPLESKHRIICLRVAIKRNLAAKNAKIVIKLIKELNTHSSKFPLLKEISENYQKEVKTLEEKEKDNEKEKRKRKIK